jgi:hypothetical protein
VTSEGGVGTTDDEKIFNVFGSDRLLKIVSYFSGNVGRLFWSQGAGISEDEENRTFIPQSYAQSFYVPLHQQQATMNRLGTGGVVIENYNFWLVCHLLFLKI